MPSATALTVSQLTALIKQSLEGTFPGVWVEGEISNSRLHTSGHFYFTLKDEGAQISGVMWRSRVAALSFKPEDGMKVQVKGSLTVYPPRGNYQIDAVAIQPLGIGELQAAFERLRQKLKGEGLFDASHKRPLPEFPTRIGLVTSPTGAAIQDIRSVLARRFPSVEVVLAPVRVQGPGAAEEIARAVALLNDYGQLDLMIVGRGGGSLEDLWAFNEEIVARAIYGSTIPVVSAVGHEIDFSIADFVADLRAPTPSAAAELVVPDRVELLESLRNLWYTLDRSVKEMVSDAQVRIEGLLSSYSFNRPRDMLRQYAQRVDELERALGVTARHMFDRVQQHQVSLLQRLESLSPRNVLGRGYAIVHRGEHIVSRSGQLSAGDRASVEFQDGTVPMKVEDR
jgi:exodeoxyribonuclease VII large subunit